MSRHFEKTITQAQELVAETGQRERTDPMTGREIESFVKGFDLSEAATRRIVREWTSDSSRAYRQGYDSGYYDASEQ